MSLLVGGKDEKQVRDGGASKGERSIKGERETVGDIYSGERRGQTLVCLVSSARTTKRDVQIIYRIPLKNVGPDKMYTMHDERIETITFKR